MRLRLTTEETWVLGELLRRAQAIGHVRRVGITLPIVAEIRGIERRKLERAMLPDGKDQASALFVLLAAWKITMEDLLGAEAGRCILREAPGPWKIAQDAAKQIMGISRKHIMSRRVACLSGRNLDYYDDVCFWGEQSAYLGALVCMAAVVLEGLKRSADWKPPKR